MKMKNILVILFFFAPTFLFGQISIIDSLTNLKNTTSDTTKILAICELIERKIDVNDTSSLSLLFEEGIKTSEELNFNRGLVKLYGHYGKLYYYKSDYEKSIESFFTSLKYAEKFGDKLLLAKIYNNISNVFFDLGNFEKAKDYTKKSLKISNEINDKRAISYCFLMFGNIHFANELTDSAEYYYTKVLNIFKENSEKNYEEINDITLIYNNFGALYTATEEFNKALLYYEKALLINEKNGNVKRRSAVFNNNIAGVYQKKKEFEKALLYAFRGLKIAKNILAKDLITDSYFIISGIYSEQNKFDKSLKYLNYYISLKDSLQSGKTNEKITALQIEYKTEKQKQQIILLKKEAEISKLKWFLSLTGTSAFLILVILLLNRRRIKLRKDKLIAVQKQELSKLQLDKAKVEIKFKNKDLENFTRNLEEKNRLIEKFQSGIVQLLDEKNENLKHQKQNELFNMKILTEDDWLEFQSVFSGVYGGFLNKLNDNYPNLTEGDRRQLILMKLGLSGKHAASSLGISYQAVQKARRRLTLKLGLSETKELKEIVENIDND